MSLILFDDQARERFFPFTHTRPVADIRCGILTMRERWEKYFGITGSSTLTHFSLTPVFPFQSTDDDMYVNGRVVATKDLARAVKTLNPDQRLISEDGLLIAFRTGSASGALNEVLAHASAFTEIIYPRGVDRLDEVWDIFSKNAAMIGHDFVLLTSGRIQEKIPEYVTVIGAENIFIEPGAKVAPCIINAADGPVYIGEDAEIMEGALVRGPFSLGANACLKMGAKIYGGTTIGEGCKVGGEVNNAVFFNHSNKGHDGFIGNAVIGDWCNLGADTNCSNLKNNYDEVKIWNEQLGAPVATGLQFCGLLMGDHSKCGINTMFNTGTVVGVSCNIFGAGFPGKFLPSFTWGGINENAVYRLDKAIEAANRMMTRRNMKLSGGEAAVFEYLFDQQRAK
ncbi:MAG TPA: GlmU family protein [Edaphocola sp.]|nr:GlmU family protein [Edaphocola sp.]